MFAFNTADPTELQQQIERLDAAAPRCLLPDVRCYYEIRDSTISGPARRAN
jgi:hypothetical protein